MADQRCHRCLQPTPVRARRCPHCGDILRADFRRLNIYVAVALAFGVLAIVGFSLFLKPTTADLEDVPEAERPKAAEPAPPVKKPPLN
jgi:hypothetical protein